MNYLSAFLVTYILSIVSLPLSLASDFEDPRVLLIGDSHSVGPFGRLISDELKSITQRSSIYASCGTVASSWMNGSKTQCGFFFRTEENKVLRGAVGRTPKLPILLETLKPDLLIVELSGNYSRGYDAETAVADMAKIIELIRGSPIKCLWVSAPDSRKFPEIRKHLHAWVLEAVGERCSVINGHEHTRYPPERGDGIHYSEDSDVRAWVDAVILEVRTLLAKPL